LAQRVVLGSGMVPYILIWWIAHKLRQRLSTYRWEPSESKAQERLMLSAQ